MLSQYNLRVFKIEPRVGQSVHPSHVFSLDFNYNEIKEHLKEKAWLLIQDGNKNEFFFHLSRCFGKPIPQRGMDSSGFVSIKSSMPGGTLLFKNTNYQASHTDLAYESRAPDVVVLWCIQSANQGGENRICVIDQIISDLLKLDSELILCLSEKDAITYIFDRKTISKPVFSYDSEGNLLIQITPFANAIYGKTSKHEQMFVILTKFLHETDRCYEFLLKSGDILILDNRRVTHARKAFYGERLIKRVWFDFHP